MESRSYGAINADAPQASPRGGSPLLGPRPMFPRALSTSGPGAADLVLPNGADADILAVNAVEVSWALLKVSTPRAPRPRPHARR